MPTVEDVETAVGKHDLASVLPDLLDAPQDGGDISDLGHLIGCVAAGFASRWAIEMVPTPNWRTTAAGEAGLAAQASTKLMPEARAAAMQAATASPAPVTS